MRIGLLPKVERTLVCLEVKVYVNHHIQSIFLCHISYYVISIIDTFARRKIENEIACVGEEAFVKHIVFLSKSL